MSSSRSFAPRRGRVARVLAMPAKRRALLGEAMLELALAAAAIRLRPFRQALASAASPLGKRAPITPAVLAEIVARAGQLVPFRAVCFQQGLALQRMARRRGIDARLHYGVGLAHPELGSSGKLPGDLQAHVWVTVGTDGILGHEQAPYFRELLRSPA